MTFGAAIFFPLGHRAAARHYAHLVCQWLALSRMSGLRITADFIETQHDGPEKAQLWQCVARCVFIDNDQHTAWLRALPLPKNAELLFPGDPHWPAPQSMEEPCH